MKKFLENQILTQKICDFRNIDLQSVYFEILVNSGDLRCLLFKSEQNQR